MFLSYTYVLTTIVHKFCLVLIIYICQIDEIYYAITYVLIRVSVQIGAILSCFVVQLGQVSVVVWIWYLVSSTVFFFHFLFIFLCGTYFLSFIFFVFNFLFSFVINQSSWKYLLTHITFFCSYAIHIYLGTYVHCRLSSDGGSLANDNLKIPNRWCFGLSSGSIWLSGGIHEGLQPIHSLGDIRPRSTRSVPRT